jgi:hypothetical protein
MLFCRFKFRNPKKMIVSPFTSMDESAGKVNEGQDNTAEVIKLEEPVRMPDKVPKTAFSDDQEDQEEDMWHEMSNKMNLVSFWIILAASLMMISVIFIFR